MYTSEKNNYPVQKGYNYENKQTNYDLEAQQQRATGYGFPGNNGFHEPEIRRGFQVKVFGLVTAMMTVVAASIVIFNVDTLPLKEFCRNPDHWWLPLTALLIWIISYMSVVCCFPLRKMPYTGMSIVAITTAAFTGIITSYYDVFAVIVAFAGTAVIVFGCGLIAYLIKVDFTEKVGWLYGITLGVVVVALFATLFLLFAPLTTRLIVSLVLSCIFALLASVWIIWDIQVIIGGRHKKYSFSIDDYAFAAITLFVDIIILFQNLLAIVGLSSRM
eukprot:g3680.t1